MNKLLLTTLLTLPVLGGCSLMSSERSKLSNEDLQKTVHWMVDDAVMAASTQIVYELRSELATQQAAYSAPNVGYSLPETPTAAVTSISDANRNDAQYFLTPTPKQCVDRVKFVKDISIPDGTVVIAGKPFTKTWLLKNTGTCQWNDQYHFVYAGGNAMGAKERISFPKGMIVQPDDTIEISVYMTAPETRGHYTGNWLIEDEIGQKFGTGNSNMDPVWVKVEVR